MKSDQKKIALKNALTGVSAANYPAIFEGFISKGIKEGDIKPRQNVFTFHAWKALGRVVRKGEKGVRIFTFVDFSGDSEADENDQTEKVRAKKPRKTTVFHISQTKPLEKQ